MRDGRRQRLGLQTGTEGTVGDTYLDRILSDVEVAGEPNILSLDPDANVRTTDQRYVPDAYNYTSPIRMMQMVATFCLRKNEFCLGNIYVFLQ